MANDGPLKRVTDPSKYFAKNIPSCMDAYLPSHRETSLDKLLSSDGNQVQSPSGKVVDSWSPDLQLLLTARMREMMDTLGRAPLREEALIDLAKRAHPEYSAEELFAYVKRDPQSGEVTLKKLLKVDEYRAAQVQQVAKEAADATPKRTTKPIRKVITRAPAQQPTPPEPEVQSVPVEQPPPPPPRRPPATIIGPTGTMRVQVADVIFGDRVVVLIQETDNDVSFWEPPMDESITWRISHEGNSADCVYSGISYDVDRYAETHFIFLITE